MTLPQAGFGEEGVTQRVWTPSIGNRMKSYATWPQHGEFRASDHIVTFAKVAAFGAVAGKVEGVSGSSSDNRCCPQRVDPSRRTLSAAADHLAILHNFALKVLLSLSIEPDSTFR